MQHTFLLKESTDGRKELPADNVRSSFHPARLRVQTRLSYSSVILPAASWPTKKTSHVTRKTSWRPRNNNITLVRSRLRRLLSAAVASRQGDMDLSSSKMHEEVLDTRK
ncbi:uncharacterized protein ACO6RY_14087 [Pungitius sinensis]